jgi:TM2 domain-containing membrane protein YozV
LVTEIGKRKIIATILTIVIWGLGHAYIKRIKRGLALFFVSLAIMFGVSFVIPFPFSLVVGLGYVIWLIYDVIRIINMQYATHSNDELFMKFFGRDKNKKKKNYLLLVVLLAVLLATLLRAGVMRTNSYILS